MEHKFEVNRKELDKVTYLRNIDENRNLIPLLTYYNHNDKKWQKWIIVNSALEELIIIDLFKGLYLSDFLVNEKIDIRLPLCETIFKYFYTIPIYNRINQIIDDLTKSFGHLDQYFILLNKSTVNGRDIISTQLEGIFGLHRSFYDLIQQLINEVISTFSDRKVNIPDSFRKVIQKSSHELREKYNFSPELAKFYSNRYKIFFEIRSIRDQIFHHGNSFNSIFSFDDGYAIPVDEKPWVNLNENFNIWPQERLRNNRLGSVLAIYILLINDIIQTMNDLSNVLIALGSPVKECFTCNVYLRNNLFSHFTKLTDYEQNHWIYPQSVC